MAVSPALGRSDSLTLKLVRLSSATDTCQSPPSLYKLSTELTSILDKYANELGSKSSTEEAGGPVNVLHISAVSDELSGGIDSMEKAIVGQMDKLKMLGFRTVNMLLPVSQKDLF